MDQVENRSAADFSQRTNRLAARLGVALRQLPPYLDISERMIFAYREGESPVSEKALRKLAAAEVQAGLRSAAPIRSEPYRKSGMKDDFSVEEPQASYGRMLTPGHEPPPAEPTAQHCIDYFNTYLAKALQSPGGVGFTWHLLQKHFPLDEFAPKNPPPP